jgi:hypothetical protein
MWELWFQAYATYSRWLSELMERAEGARGPRCQYRGSLEMIGSGGHGLFRSMASKILPRYCSNIL